MLLEPTPDDLTTLQQHNKATTIEQRTTRYTSVLFNALADLVV